jgi:bacterioferritin
MKGNNKVLEVLSEVLSAELTAINQYFAHAMMCKNWHYERLAEHNRKESIDEMKHAQEVIERILYLEGTPNMSAYMKINIGADVKQQHLNDLELEKSAVERLNRGAGICRETSDNGTRVLLETILADEEKSIDFLEAQLQQIEDVGIENYLAQQIEK